MGFEGAGRKRISITAPVLRVELNAGVANIARALEPLSVPLTISNENTLE